MSALKNKTILIISPQSWGKMFISKHHYAIELAAYGNQVYFLNPPDTAKKKYISISASEKYHGLYLVEHGIGFSYNLKFHVRPLYNILMKWHIRKLLKAIGKHVDIVWSFDLGNLYPLTYFPSEAIKIFHPVDEPLNPDAIQSANGADMIISVTNEILQKYIDYKVPRYFVDHGVSDIFLRDNFPILDNHKHIRVGISGNFLRPDIDRPILLKIIGENPEVNFDCWGSYRIEEANISGATDKETIKFVKALQACANVKLHGAVSIDQLASEFNSMDAFLVCYDIKKDQSKGTNYHKILEYLSTGKVVVSNNVTTYKNRRELLVMADNRNNNDELPGLFKAVIQNLSYWNEPEMIKLRKQFSLKNRYVNHIVEIAGLIERSNP